MTIELSLLIVGVLHAVLLSLHAIYIIGAHGLLWAIGRRSMPVTKTDVDRRFERTIANNVESLVAFIPVALVALFLGEQTPVVLIACAVYVAGRVGFMLSYLANVPVIRTLFWSAANLSIYVVAASAGHRLLSQLLFG